MMLSLYNRRLLFVLGLLALVVVFPSATRADQRQQATTPNLIVNADFERELPPWQLCGGAQRVDAQATGASAAHGGRYAIQFNTPTTGTGCPEPPEGYAYLGTAPQAVWQMITIPADASAVTVSFWYWVSGQPHSDLDVYLASNMYQFTNSLEGAVLERVSPYALPGWQLYRRVLKPDEVQQARGKTLLLAFRLDDPLEEDATQVVRIDDVRVAVADERTAAVSLPAALRADGTQPLAVLREKPDDEYTQSLYRMDTDGQNAHLIYRGQLEHVKDVAWSNTGQQIALVDGNISPAGETDVNTSVSATALVVINADGSQPRTVYQTGGIPGSPCPFTSTPGTGETPDFIQELTGLSWSPDDRTIAGSIFAYNRYCSGQLGGGLARIELFDPATGANTKILDDATEPNWSRTNRLLFSAYDLAKGNRAGSVWDSDRSPQPPTDQQLLAANGFDDDQYPVWSPDGRSFVTVRPTMSYRFDAEGHDSRNQAMMLFDRQDVAHPRMILLADHGSVAYPVWSPDGTYIAYSLQNGLKSDIWWLDVATGATGPITSDGLSTKASWRRVAGTAPQQQLFLPVVRR